MKDKNKVVFGIFRTRDAAERAVTALKSEGFTTSDISVLMPNSGGGSELAMKKETKAPEGAATGAGAGALLGGTLGLLAGIGALAIPGVGPLIAAGPIMGALAGLGVGSAIGGVSGALIGLGIPEFEAKRYEGYVKNGGILFSVHADNSDQCNQAKAVLERAGATDVAISGEVKTDAKVSGLSTEMDKANDLSKAV